MISHTFQHIRGIGPVAESRLMAAGFASWADVLSNPERLPLGRALADELVAELTRSARALEENDLEYLIERFSTSEQWRILGLYFDRASYFDIETSGLDFDAKVMVICCCHKGKLLPFVRGENLDDFLKLLDDIELLISFNGSSFDVPQLLDLWHIPALPCPHIDLRWVCYHCELRGGLKAIEQQLTIDRPPDLAGLDGADAVWLWEQYRETDDEAARAQVIRYCAADVVTLQLVAAEALRLKGFDIVTPSADALWRLLDGFAAPPSRQPVLSQQSRLLRERLAAFQ